MPDSIEKQYTAVMGMVTISTGNPNLDGTGTITDILTGSTNGTRIKTVVIKAQRDTSQGMIRFFIKKSGNYILVSEVFVPPVIKSSRDISFYRTINLEYTLENSDVLCVSTEKSEFFNVFVEAFDIAFSATTNFIGSSLEFIARAGVKNVLVANPNLDGTGVIVNVLTAGAATYKGCALTSLVIKAQQTTTPGMIRFFLQSNTSTTKYLLFEVIVPSVVNSSNLQTFSCQALAAGSFCIPPEYSILASTEKSEKFSIVCEGFDWKNV